MSLTLVERVEQLESWCRGLETMLMAVNESQRKMVNEKPSDAQVILNLVYMLLKDKNVQK